VINIASAHGLVASPNKSAYVAAKHGIVGFTKTVALEVAETGVRGLMIGRGAIRNPWLFQQIRQRRNGSPVVVPSGKDVLAYLRALYEAVKPPEVHEMALVQKMKKYLNFVGLGVEPTGQFLHQIRRVTAEAEFFVVGDADHRRPDRFTLFVRVRSLRGLGFLRTARLKTDSTYVFSASAFARSWCLSP
jgi:NAD(P)-dependent dehydrogenase (short-subunit alcohol dehydrogenase family)